MINCDGLVKIYETDDKKVMALEGLDLTVETGEMLAVIGKSGSGKSTLLNMIGGLETPTAGVLTIDGKDISLKSRRRVLSSRIPDFPRHVVSGYHQSSCLAAGSLAVFSFG